jgi:hypothetical protein
MGYRLMILYKPSPKVGKNPFYMSNHTHVGNLTKQDAEDLVDFTIALLERLITEPKKLELAEARRKARRSS